MKQRSMQEAQSEMPWVVGLNVSDRRSTVCRMDAASREILE